MPGINTSSLCTCIRCLRRQSRCLRGAFPSCHGVRTFRTSRRLPLGGGGNNNNDGAAGGTTQEMGAMSRRLEEMTQQSIEHDGRRARKVVEEAGFSEQLKNRLEARLEDAEFRSKNPAAFSVLGMPSSAGKGSRAIAEAKPWTGTESVEEAALRMLTDAHKPIRMRAPRIPSVRSIPSGNVDIRMKKAVQRSAGERLANARDRTSMYALSQDENLSEKEKEDMRKMLKERFQPAARPMPTTIQGLASLANERIEDAIARGQFKNIPRGKGTNVERDYNASSPFLDTTEYFMNKMIQRQDIVPPWIEKQQEVAKMAAAFRARLRNDWKRHAARVIASKGGALEAQVRRAEAYAAAEAVSNPRTPKVEALSAIDSAGNLSRATITERKGPAEEGATTRLTVTESQSGANTAPLLDPIDELVENLQGIQARDASKASPAAAATGEPQKPPMPEMRTIPVAPFRDPQWEKLELSYQTLVLKELNSLTRSYNLMAPELAKKPYFSLQRELQSCFADVAPQLPSEIVQRANAPTKIKPDFIGHNPGGVLGRLAGEQARVYDSRKPHYGFKELWRDIWGGEKRRVV